MSSRRVRAGHWVFARGRWVGSPLEAHERRVVDSGDGHSVADPGEKGALRSRSPSEANARSAASPDDGGA
eukprot:610696-Alexandrium_andersonii.AAC.1